MRLNRPVVIIVGALAMVLGAYLLSSGHQDSEEAGGKYSGEPGAENSNISPPKDRTLWLTVPKMEHIKYAEIPTGTSKDEGLFHDYAGVHIEHTGWPWEKEANVYIAGHRLGYPHTQSWLAFWDLDKLEKGDEINITDSELRNYTYVVYEKSVGKGSSCGPMTSNTLSDLEPVEGKNIVTLQTCTLPDYKKRLLVRGELRGISGE